MSSEEWVIFDIDGTLANIVHRLHHIGKEKPDWDAFNSEMAADVPKEDILVLHEMCTNSGYNIAIVTGRFDDYEEDTRVWLHENNITFHELHMRPSGNYSHDFLIKERIFLDQFVAKDRKIRFVVDDRDQVVEMWRANGVTCLQCQKGDY